MLNKLIKSAENGDEKVLEHYSDNLNQIVKDTFVPKFDYEKYTPEYMCKRRSLIITKNKRSYTPMGALTSQYRGKGDFTPFEKPRESKSPYYSSFVSDYMDRDNSRVRF